MSESPHELCYDTGSRRAPFFIGEIMTVAFYSQVFDRYIEAQEIDDLPLKDVYIILDELQSHKEVLEKRWNKIPKKDYSDETHEDLIYETRAINTLVVVAKRRAHFLNQSKVQQLTRGVTIWKKRAFILGKQLGLSQEQVKDIQVYSKGA